MRRSVVEIVLGFAVACLAAACIGLVAFRGDGGLAFAGLIPRLVTSAIGLAPYALPGGIAAVIVSEWLGLRNVLFHALAGAATAVLGALLKVNDGVPAITGTDAQSGIMALLAMGLAGGLGYWAMRGHKAGQGFPWAGAHKEEPRCWPCVIAGLLAAALPLFMAAVWASNEGQWVQNIRERAERTAATELGKAGFDWAALKVDDAAGRIVGMAPDAATRDAAFSKAGEILKPMMGLPGVFSVLVNEIDIAKAPSAPGAGTAPAGVPPAVSAEAARQAEAERQAHELALARKAEEDRMTAEAAKAKAEQERIKDEAAKAKTDEERRAAEALQAKADAESRAAEAARAKAEAQRIAAEAAAKKTAEDRRIAEQADLERQAAEARAALAGASQHEDCFTGLETLVHRDRIRFGSLGSAIKVANGTILDRLAAGLKSCAGAQVRVDGHSDAQGSAEANDALSLRRAEAVRQALIVRGVAPERVTAKGFGESAPLWPADTPEAWAQNRRIEFTLSQGSLTPTAAATAVSAAAPSPDTTSCRSELAAQSARGRIEFTSGASRIARVSNPLLRKLANTLKACPALAVRIDGHTDSVGSAEFNQALSERRAANVRTALIAVGVDAARITSRGFGESEPLYPADTPEAYARNRRIEFTVLDNTP